MEGIKGTRACAAASAHTFAFHNPKLTVPPAQLRISCANRLGSGFSCEQSKLLEIGPWKVIRRRPYDRPAIDAHNKVEPWLDG